MSLSRKELLEEMGIAPVWVRRDGLPAARQTVQPKERVARRVEPVPSTEIQGSTGVVARSELARPVSGGEHIERIERMDWGTLQQSIAACRACGLCAERKQAVPGVGDERAAWLFIGEGPGAEEDARGEPFVGQAGKLLDAMLEAIGLKRGADVYIANAVKCRPPGNRTPEAAELAACFPFLKRQIALIQPKLIVLLGKTAVSSVLGEDGSLGSLRGKNLSYRDGDSEIPVVVTYHPAYLLRNLPDKAKAWEDLCRARALMRELQGA
jgi:DNA polymerase